MDPNARMRDPIFDSMETPASQQGSFSAVKPPQVNPYSPEPVRSAPSGGFGNLNEVVAQFSTNTEPRASFQDTTTAIDTNTIIIGKDQREVQFNEVWIWEEYRKKEALSILEQAKLIAVNVHSPEGRVVLPQIYNDPLIRPVEEPQKLEEEAKASFIKLPEAVPATIGNTINYLEKGFKFIGKNHKEVSDPLLGIFKESIFFRKPDKARDDKEKKKKEEEKANGAVKRSFYNAMRSARMEWAMYKNRISQEILARLGLVGIPMDKLIGWIGKGANLNFGEFSLYHYFAAAKAKIDEEAEALRAEKQKQLAESQPKTQNSDIASLNKWDGQSRVQGANMAAG